MLDAALESINAQQARASVAADKKAITELVLSMPGGFQSLDATVRQHLKTWFERCGAQATSWRVQSHLRRRVKHDSTAVDDDHSPSIYMSTPASGQSSFVGKSPPVRRPSPVARNAPASPDEAARLSGGASASMSATAEQSDVAVAQASLTVEESDGVVRFARVGAEKSDGASVSTGPGRQHVIEPTANAGHPEANIINVGDSTPCKKDGMRREDINVVAGNAELTHSHSPASVSSDATRRNLSPLPDRVILEQISEI